MSTTYTPNAGLGKPARADRNWDVQLNANCDALDACAAIGGLAVTPTEFPSASLNVKVAAGQFRKSDGTLAAFAGTPSQAVTANATTYLWLTETGVLTTGTAFPSGTNIVLLATVTAGASTITTVSDQRTPWFSFGMPTSGTGTGSVTSVGLSLPSDWTVTNSPVTTTGVLTATRANQNANVVFAGPASGGPASPSYRALVGADLPVFAASGTAHAPGAVPDPGGTAGTTRFLREDATWAAPPSGGSSGVTSVGLSMPLQFTVSGAPVTSTGTFAIGWNNQAANQVLAGPPSGTAAAPTYRALVGADLPVFGPSGTGHAPGAVPDPGAAAGATRFLREDGTWQAPATGTGTVTSVGLSLPADFSVSGAPVTSSGTFTVTRTAQAANVVFAGPSSGTAAAPTYRALVGADLPVFGPSGASHAPGAVPDPGAGSSGATALVQSTGTFDYGSANTNPLSVTFGTATTTGHLLAVVVAGKAGSGSTAPTFTVSDTSGGTWTQAAYEALNTSGGYSVAIWYLANITGESSHAVSVIPSVASYLSIGVYEISGAATASPLGATAINNGSGTSPAAPGASCAAGSFLLAGTANDSGSGMTISSGSSWTAGYANTSMAGILMAGEYHANIAAGTITPSFTQSASADWAIVMAEFKAGAGSSLAFLGNDAAWHTIAAGVSSAFGRTGAVVATSGDYAVSQITGAAPLASPALTGTPTAPTAANGTNTTQLATTAFVLANAGTGAVASVANSDGTLTISPTTGSVVAALNLAHANTWTATQTHLAATTIATPLVAQAAPTLTATITNVALTSNVATITTSAAHGFTNGATVTNTGLTTTALNVTAVITSVPSGTTFTFALTHANITSTADSGTATVAQSAPVQSWNNGAGTTVASVAGTGDLTIGSSSSSNVIFATDILANSPGIWFNTAAATSSNYVFLYNSSNALFNAPAGALFLRSKNATGLCVYAAASAPRSIFGSAVTTTSGDTAANVSIVAPSSTTKGLSIVAAASQTANLQEWQSSSGTVLASVSATGVFTGSGAGLTGVPTSNTWPVTTPSSYPYTCLSTDLLVLVDTSAARTITLPSGSSAGIGRIYALKDATGSAATNNITVAISGGGTIDGATQAVIVNNLGEAEFISDGTNWRRKYNRPDRIDGNLTVTRQLLIGGSLNPSVCSFTTQTFTLNPNLSINLVNYTGSGGVTATLPTAASVGTNLLLVVKDMAGTAGTSNITIQAAGTDKIDGAAAITITANYGAVRLICDGSSNWYSW